MGVGVETGRRKAGENVEMVRGLVENVVSASGPGQLQWREDGNHGNASLTLDQCKRSGLYPAFSLNQVSLDN
jgi:hypothetical protein